MLLQNASSFQCKPPHSHRLISSRYNSHVHACRYGRVILERLIDALNHGPESQHSWALHILQTIFETPDLDLGPDCQLLAEAQLTYSVAACLETDKGHQALQVCSQGSCLLKLKSFDAMAQPLPWQRHRFLMQPEI